MFCLFKMQNECSRKAKGLCVCVCLYVCVFSPINPITLKFKYSDYLLSDFASSLLSSPLPPFPLPLFPFSLAISARCIFLMISPVARL